MHIKDRVHCWISSMILEYVGCDFITTQPCVALKSYKLGVFFFLHVYYYSLIMDSQKWNLLGQKL